MYYSLCSAQICFSLFPVSQSSQPCEVAREGLFLFYSLESCNSKIPSLSSNDCAKTRFQGIFHTFWPPTTSCCPWGPHPAHCESTWSSYSTILSPLRSTLPTVARTIWDLIFLMMAFCTVSHKSNWLFSIVWPSTPSIEQIHSFLLKYLFNLTLLHQTEISH